MLKAWLRIDRKRMNIKLVQENRMPQFKWTNEEGEEDDQARLWESKLGVKKAWGNLQVCLG